MSGIPEESALAVTFSPEALRCMLHHEFAVILLDVKMPIMDGFETAELIRRRKKFAHTPIIFVTAYEDEMHTAKGYSLGAVDYILTPIIPTVLSTKVKVFVQLFRMREEIRQHAEERVALAREQAGRAAAEEAIRRSNLLISASRVLSASLDVDAILKGISQFAVPFLCETCALALVDDKGQVTHVAGAASTLAGGRMVVGSDTLRALFAGALAEPVARALDQGEPAFADLDPAHVIALADKGERPDVPGIEIRVSQAALFPLWARGRKLGVLREHCQAVGRPYEQIEKTTLSSFNLTRDGRNGSTTPAALLEELAQQAALGIDQAIFSLQNVYDIEPFDLLANEVVPAAKNIQVAGR